MLRLPTNILQPGMVLAKPVINERGQVLLRQNIPLTQDYITTLKRRGYTSIYINDGDTDDIQIEEILSQDAQRQAQATLALVFDFVEQVSTNLNHTQSETIVADLRDPGVASALRGHEGFKHLEQMVSTILDNLLESDTVTSIAQIRNHNDIIFSHSVNVTTTALMIGKRLHLNQKDLERLGAGCLLHDIGKIFLDQTILHEHKNSSLNPVQQFTLQREHPRLGYELLRARNPDASLINHVALEHHERQDGRGYPRGLRGTNKVERISKDPQNVMLIAEIAAVADVYDILSAEKPGRSALTPQQITDTMRRLSGTFLNREVTQLFLSMLPALPLGIGIVVQTGRYTGYKGVVAQINQKQPERPLVRLLYNPQGDRIMPIELDLARESSLTVEATLSL